MKVKKSFAEATSEGNELSVHNVKQIIRREKIEHQFENKLKSSDEGNIFISLFHRIRATATCYFLFNLQGKNAQICADFPSIKN